MRSLIPGLRIILALFLVNGVVIVLQFSLTLRGENAVWISHFYGFIEFVTMTFVFSLWASKPQVRRILYGVILAYIVFWVAAKVFLEIISQTPFYSALTARVLLTAISIYTLHSLSNELRIVLYKDPRFWVAAGLLIASSGGLLFYALRTVIDQLPREGLLVAYSAHWSIITIANCLYTVAFLCKPQARNSGGQLELAQ